MLNVHTTIHLKTRRCPLCGEHGLLQVPGAALAAYRAGALAQDAFPMLTADDREQIISGVHPACWDTL